MAYDDTNLVRDAVQRRYKQHKKGKASMWVEEVEDLLVETDDEFDEFDEVDYQRKRKAHRTRRDRDEE